jgi:2',3'-cyclic-nucleotide 2'-phosphodiesterase (5'-nucleotidase family)
MLAFAAMFGTAHENTAGAGARGARARRSRRPAAALAAVLALGLAGCVGRPQAAPPAAGAPPRLVVHYFNDWHGHLEPFQRPDVTAPVGGAARLARLIADRRATAAAAGADTLLLEAGDVLQGTPMSTVFRGEPDFALLERMGVDAMSLGNHEFDFGIANLRERLAQVSFPVLAANVSNADGTPFAGDAVIVTTPRHGLRVALLGLVTADTRVTTHPHNVADLTFADPVATAARYLPRLAAESDLVVVVSHSGVEVDREIAALPGVDLVVGGHDQDLLEPPPVVGGVPVVQAHEWGEYLGEATFAAGRGGDLRWAGNRYLRVTADLPEDPEVAAFVGSYRARLGSELGKVVATTAVRLDGQGRNQETNLGNVVADALLLASGADVAFINAGAIRASLEPGDITLEELMTVLPFDNRLVVVRLTGAELRSMLEQSLRDGGGGFLQVAGVRLRETAAGVEAEVGGAALDDAKLYDVATSDFLVAGGDGYEQALGKAMRETGYGLLDAVLRWIELQPQPLDVAKDGRIELAREAAALRDAA